MLSTGGGYGAEGKLVTPPWLHWVRQLKAIAQNGTTYSKNPFDVERYHALEQLATEIAAAHVELPLDTVRETFARETGPATPKLDVRAGIIRDDGILLVKERSDGLWTLPGGWIDVEESASEAAVRETREESGYECRVVKLIAALDRNRHGHPPILFHTYKLIFLCELTGGAAAESVETDGTGFFPENELPPLSTSRVTPAQIHRVFEHHRTPNLPTDFD
jgi:ADP-ribose pyrophosphatase YjhB (NUDIX family)